MSEEEIEKFGENIASLDKVNRCYVWRIFWSHVKSGELKIKHFLAFCGERLLAEDNEDIILFLLAKLKYCIDMGFLNADQMKKNMLPTIKKVSDLTEFRENVLATKMFSGTVSDSLKTQLATYMICFNYPRDEDYWRGLVTTGVITSSEGDQTYSLNKLQRYQCISQLAKWGHNYEQLFAVEFANSYSDADEHAKHRVEASRASFDEKVELWESYLVADKWKQAYFDSSVFCFLNKNETEEMSYFAD